MERLWFRLVCWFNGWCWKHRVEKRDIGGYMAVCDECYADIWTRERQRQKDLLKHWGIREIE